MSASLVGSEMCIRDRPLPTTSLSSSGRWSGSGAPVSRFSPPPTRPAWCCLLYTSDAADDM
eukprot:6295978-Alexandrium_andersonii.AAC.1